MLNSQTSQKIFIRTGYKSYFSTYLLKWQSYLKCRLLDLKIIFCHIEDFLSFLSVHFYAWLSIYCSVFLFVLLSGRLYPYFSITLLLWTDCLWLNLQISFYQEIWLKPNSRYVFRKAFTSFPTSMLCIPQVYNKEIN